MSKSLKAVSICALSSTTFAWCLSQSAISARPVGRSTVTKARHVFGTQSASAQRTSQIWGPRCGALMVSRFWEHLWEHKVRLVHHGGGTEVVGGHPICPDLQCAVAERKSTLCTMSPMCQSSSLENTTRAFGQLSKRFYEAPGSEQERCSGGKSPDAHGRAWFEISPKVCPRSVLGVMGGRIAHDSATSSCQRSHRVHW